MSRRVTVMWAGGRGRWETGRYLSPGWGRGSPVLDGVPIRRDLGPETWVPHPHTGLRPQTGLSPLGGPWTRDWGTPKRGLGPETGLPLTTFERTWNQRLGNTPPPHPVNRQTNRLRTRAVKMNCTAFSWQHVLRYNKWSRGPSSRWRSYCLGFSSNQSWRALQHITGDVHRTCSWLLHVRKIMLHL